MRLGPWWLLVGTIVVSGCVAPASPPTTVLTVVSADRQTVATVEAVGEKYVLRVVDEAVLAFDNMPTEVEFSPTGEALLVIVNGELYRYDRAARQATRLYEGVITAEFSPSGQDINYTTNADF